MGFLPFQGIVIEGTVIPDFTVNIPLNHVPSKDSYLSSGLIRFVNITGHFFVSSCEICE